ncbi:MAG TPA: peptidase M20, partial [Verrucomicrobiae bacterium]
IDALASELRRVIDDLQIEVVPPVSPGRPATPPVPIDTEMFAALERAQRKLFPKAITVPLMTVGATDSAQLRAKGVKAYGVSPVMNDGDSVRMHGNDERIAIAGLEKFLEFLWAAVTDVAGAK